MSGWVAGIGAVGALGAGAMGLIGQSQQAGQQQSALQMAMRDYQLRKEMMERQYELATAGQTDARGNMTRYRRGTGWTTQLTPESQSMLNRSDAVQNNQYVESLGRGVDERRSAFNRRLSEGSAASPLLAAMQNGYGAPSREGVGGANRIANVTGVSEGADQARSGFAGAALRTGSGTVPLQNTIAGIDRGAATGIRSALARGDAEEGPMFEQMMAQFNEGKLNPYNMLASRASNVENMPFNPEGISSSTDGRMLMQGRSAVAGNAAGMQTMAGAVNPLLTAMYAQRQPNYDTFIGGLTDNAKNLVPLFAGGGSSNTAMSNYLTNRGRDPSYRGGGGF